MLVPRSRLLLWVAVLVVPLATLAGIFERTISLSIVLIGGFCVAVFIDALLARRRLSELRIELPEVSRFSKDRLSEVELRIANDTRQQRQIRVGLALPPELHSEQEDMTAILPAGAPLARLAWRCVPRKRGRYMVDRCYIETASAMGFWALQKSVPARGEIRVYPNLLAERKNVAALFLNRGSFGVHAQRQIGKGRDFEKLREYVPGDGSEDIHWKATAKRGKPVTKVFQIERTQEIYVLIDASRLSGREVPMPRSVTERGNAEQVAMQQAVTTSLLERYVTAALVLGVAAEQQGDLFGLLTFSDKVQKFVRAKSGKSHYAACRDAIYTLQPQTVTPDFDELASFVRLRLRRRALLVVLTSLDDPVLAESFVRNMDLICRQHVILVNMMQPGAARPIFSNADVASTEELYHALGGHVLWHNLRELDKTLQRRGVRFTLLENEQMSAQLISQYLTVKQRQLL